MNAAVIIVRYQTLPDQVETAEREIAALIATVQSVEPDCRGISMLQDSSDPTRILLIEHWTSQEIFLGPHMQQPHIQSFIHAAGAFLAGPPDITFWHAVTGI